MILCYMVMFTLGPKKFCILCVTFLNNGYLSFSQTKVITSTSNPIVFSQVQMPLK